MLSMPILNKALGLAEKMVTTTAEKYWTLLSKSKIFSKMHHIGINVMWKGLESRVFDQFWSLWSHAVFLDFVEFGDCLL